MHRIAAAALVLALCFGTACSRSDESGDVADKTTIQARELPAIWKDVLAERDKIQVATAKKHEMWHEECAAVSKAAIRLDALATEMNQRIAAMTSIGERRNGITNLMGQFEALVSKLRTDALQEAVGELPSDMIALDAFLSGLENTFTPEEVGDDRVATHPGFNPLQPAPPLSPV